MDSHPVQTPRDPAGARRKAQSHFDVAEARTTLVKKIVDEERKVVDAKTAKLRAQRLAKEEEERIEAANAPVPASAPKRRPRTKRAS